MRMREGMSAIFALDFTCSTHRSISKPATIQWKTCAAWLMALEEEELWNSWIRWAHSSGRWETGRGLDKVDFGEAMLLVVAPGCAHVRGNVGDVRLRLRVLDPWVDPKASHYAVGEVRGVAQCLDGSRAGDHKRIVTHRVIRGK